jgi:hypothetical protein
MTYSKKAAEAKATLKKIDSDKDWEAKEALLAEAEAISPGHPNAGDPDKWRLTALKRYVERVKAGASG